MSNKLKQAINAIKADDKKTGKQLLNEIIDSDPHNEYAWLWMTKVVKTNDEREQCLRKVLEINPNNERAKENLARIEQKRQNRQAEQKRDKGMAKNQPTSINPWLATSVLTAFILLMCVGLYFTYTLASTFLVTSEITQQEAPYTPTTLSAQAPISEASTTEAANIASTITPIPTSTSTPDNLPKTPTPSPTSTAVEIIVTLENSTPQFASIATPRPASEIITVNNAGQLEELANIGRGWIDTFQGNYTGMAISPDAGTLAIATNKGIWLYDTESLELIRLLTPQTGSTFGVAWSPDGDRLATGWEDAAIRIWDVVSGEQITILTKDKDVPTHLVWSPDGTQLASGARNRISIWNISQEQLLFKYKLKNYVTDIDWSSDGQTLVTTHGGLSGWDTKQPQLLRNWFAGSGKGFVGVAWSPDNTELAVGMSDGSIQIMPPNLEDFSRNFKGHLTAINALAWSPDGTKLASSSKRRDVRIWDAVTGQELYTLQGHIGKPLKLGWSLDGTYLISVDEYGTILRWNADTGSQLSTLVGHLGYIDSFRWSPDSTQLTIITSNDLKQTWNVSTGQPVTLLEAIPEDTYPPSPSRPSVSGLSPDGSKIASTYEEIIYIREPDEHGDSVTLTGHTESIETIAWSPDSRFLASGGEDTSVRIWDMVTLQEVYVLEGHSSTVHKVVWSPDGTMLTSVGADALRIWQGTNGQLLKTLDNIGHAPAKLVWSPDGQRIAWGGGENPVRIFGIPDTLLLNITPTATPFPTKASTSTPAPPPTGPQTYDVNSCMKAIKFSTTVSECVTSLTVRPDGSLQLNVSWIIENNFQLLIMRDPEIENNNVYLTDDLGNRLDHIETGGATTSMSEIHQFKVTEGWFVFPAPNPNATSFIFHDDNYGIQTIPILKGTSDDPFPTVTPTATLPPPSANLPTYDIGECITISLLGGVVYECVTSIAFRPDGRMQVNLSWSAEVEDDAFVDKGPNTESKNMYLTDNLGNRLDHLGGGGAVAERVYIGNDQTVEGWLLFPPPNPNATSFVFHDDGNKVQTSPILKQWP